MKKESQNQKNNTKWLSLINIPIQMGLIIFLFYKLGYWLDENYNHPKIYYFKLLTLTGVFIALFIVFRQVKELGKD